MEERALISFSVSVWSRVSPFEESTYAGGASG